MVVSKLNSDLSKRDYARLRDLVYQQTGIVLGSEKRTMLEGRIRRRLRELNLSSFGSYCDYLFSHQGLKDELVSFIDVVTTNKTDFFREPRHFEFLASKALPELSAGMLAGRPLSIWSAGCSTGEEPYTLAMVLSEYALAHATFRFRILATDVSTQVLRKAALGIYTSDDVEPVPPALRRRYLMRGRESGSTRVRVIPELRRLVEFQRLNFMEPDYGPVKKAHVIFCRNVLIYFDRPTQEELLQKLCLHLLPGGYLFVGHAETLHDMDLPLAPVAPALYKRTDERGR